MCKNELSFILINLKLSEMHELELEKVINILKNAEFVIKATCSKNFRKLKTCIGKPFHIKVDPSNLRFRIFQYSCQPLIYYYYVYVTYIYSLKDSR